jgi:hypothetical protein
MVFIFCEICQKSEQILCAQNFTKEKLHMYSPFACLHIPSAVGLRPSCALGIGFSVPFDAAHSISSQSPGFNPWWLGVIFVGHKMALKQDTLRLFSVSPCKSSFYHWCILICHRSPQYAIAQITQHIIRSSVFKLGASDLSLRLSQCKEGKLENQSRHF